MLILKIRFQYDSVTTLVSGESIPLDLELYGKGYQMGLYVRDDSCIRLHAQDSGLWSELKSIERDMSWTGLEVPEHLQMAAWEKTSVDTGGLFLHACGFSSIKMLKSGVGRLKRKLISITQQFTTNVVGAIL